MIATKENATWIPSTGEFLHHGWLDLNSNGDIWIILDIHSFDDLGATLDTFTIEKDGEIKEIYSYDEGETFTLDIN
jgi:hypothetical protein